MWRVGFYKWWYILKEEIAKLIACIVHWQIIYPENLRAFTERVTSAIVRNVYICVRTLIKGYLVHLNT